MASILPITIKMPGEKPVTILPYKSKGKVISGKMEWLYRQSHDLSLSHATVGTICKKMLDAVAWMQMPMISRPLDKTARMIAEAAFMKRIVDENIQAPSTRAIITVPTDITGFTHTHELYIYNHVLWTRIRHSQTNWAPIFFEEDPQRISCDGANGVVFDQNGRVHYKKLIKEFRFEELSIAEQNKLPGKEECPYVVYDKSTTNNWKDRWCTLPVLNGVVNSIVGKHLFFQKEAITSRMSHRGKYNGHFESGSEDSSVRNVHVTNVGTSTLLTLEKLAQDNLKHDPWSPPYVRTAISFFETANTSFKALNMYPSASTIMAIGYESKKENEGSSETLEILTRLADIDIVGWNPTCNYTYFQTVPANPKYIVIPEPKWKKHALPLLSGDAYITKHISIHQIGEGNNARRLMLVGANASGQKGVYFKHITEQDWQFKPFQEDDVRPSFFEALELLRYSEAPFVTTVYNYKQMDFETKIKTSLENFGQRSEESILNITLDGELFALRLHRTLTLKNFIGFKEPSYDLIVPEEYHQSIALNTFLQGKHVLRVNVAKGMDTVTISSSNPEFTFYFERSN